VEDLKKLNPDLMVTCAFGQILSQEILDIPRLGFVNIHASLLPAYRGASPIHYAILNGEKTTGVTVMKTDIGIDTGDMILQREINISDAETCGELFERLSVLGANCILEALPLIENEKAVYIKQDESKATYTKIIKKEAALIDWNDTAENIYNKIRAFNPAPVAYCFYEGNPFKIYSAKISTLNGKAGQILKTDKELIIGCGQGALSLLTVQKAGGKPMNIQDFLRGNKLTVGGDFN
ncbi:MAG: methionyl-tRNA formyltransferase, partial [Clostridia bacterium]|nr:methionyl-tRNA formyltransferase [Clostridia bacterium]